jgi:hypothetical protein
MVRWTNSAVENEHLARIAGLDLFGLVRLRGKNGRVIEGLVLKGDFGNNFHETAPNPATRGYGQILIQTIDRQCHWIDVLDIEDAKSIWDEKKDEFAKAGVITIVDYPDGPRPGDLS